MKGERKRETVRKKKKKNTVCASVRSVSTEKGDQ